MLLSKEDWAESDLTSRAFFVLKIGLAVVSYIATTWGFIDLMEIDLLREIQGGTLDGGDITGAVIVVSIATAVVVTMLIGLDAMLDRKRNPNGRLLGAVVYLFFVAWSIAFGYGFFWKSLASEEFTRNQFLTQTSMIQSNIKTIVDELEGATRAAKDASSKASSLSELESTPGGGGTCQNNPDSTGAPGPLTTARKQFADRAGAAAGAVETNWLNPVKQLASGVEWRIAALNPDYDYVFDDPSRHSQADQAELEKIKQNVRQGAEGRTQAYDIVKAKVDDFVRTTNSRRTSIGLPQADILYDLHREMTVQGDRPTSAFCSDPLLGPEVKGAADRIKGIQAVNNIAFTSLEGAAATRFAAINLFSHGIDGVGALFGAARNPKLVALGENDIIALYATTAIDFALLMVSVLARPRRRKNPRSPKARRSAASAERDEIVETMSPSELVRDGKRSAAAAEALQARSAGDIKLRKEQRLIREKGLEEDAADILLDEKEIEVRRRQRALDAQRTGGPLLDSMTKALNGNEILARAVIYALAENIERIDGDHYLPLVDSFLGPGESSARRVANFFTLHKELGVDLVDPTDELHRSFERRFLGHGGETAVRAVFRIDARLGRMMLSVIRAPELETQTAQPADPAAGEEGEGQAAGPAFGPLDENLIKLGRFGAQMSESRGAGPATSIDPMSFGGPDGAGGFTRNTPEIDPDDVVLEPGPDRMTGQFNGKASNGAASKGGSNSGKRGVFTRIFGPLGRLVPGRGTPKAGAKKQRGGYQSADSK
jgi:hypothetical protein